MSVDHTGAAFLSAWGTAWSAEEPSALLTLMAAEARYALGADGLIASHEDHYDMRAVVRQIT